MRDGGDHPNEPEECEDNDNESEISEDVDNPTSPRQQLAWMARIAAREHLSLRLSVAFSAIDHPPLGHLLFSGPK